LPAIEAEVATLQVVELDAADLPVNHTPRVVVVTPHYGSCAPGWADGVYCGSRGRQVVRMDRRARSSSSLLPTAFNECLAEAMTMRDAGDVDAIAMLHSDIEPEGRWLEELYGEAWINRAMLASAVVPIKNDEGRTSTAIGVKGDRWRVPRCIYMRDRERLPVTFGPEHVCGPDEVLLINTGMWLADLHHPFWDHFIDHARTGTSAFQLHSRIVKHGQGQYQVETRSEDYELSHDLAEFGCRYVATWKPRLKHIGQHAWRNY
jgi:hypothetical protein